MGQEVDGQGVGTWVGHLADEWLQDPSEAGVLRRIERERDQRQRIAEYVECALRRVNSRITQRAKNILAASQVIVAVTKNHWVDVT